MAYFTIKPVQAHGKARYKAKVRHKIKSIEQKSDAKTFDTFEEAEVFVKNKLQILNQASSIIVNPEIEAQIIYSNFNQKIKFETVADTQNFELAMRKSAPKQYSASIISALQIPLEYNIAKVKLVNLTCKDMEVYCTERATNGAKPSTINIDAQLIIAAIKNAAERYPDQNILPRGIDTFLKNLRKLGHICKSGKRNRRFKNGEEEKVFAEAKKLEIEHKFNHRYPVFMELLIDTCLRLSELFNLKVKDVDFENRKLTIYDLKHTNRAQPKVTFEPSMTERTIELFKMLIPSNALPDDHIFPVKGESFSSTFNKIRKNVGLVDFRLHDLRREGISRKFEEGFSALEIAQIFTGHKDKSVLEEIYIELSADETFKKIAEKNRLKNLPSPEMQQDLLSFLHQKLKPVLPEHLFNEVIAACTQ